MKELVVISGKGGTGKTSLVASFAAQAGSVVTADCDVDAADLHLLLGPEIERRHKFSGGKVASIDPELCNSCGTCQELCRYDAVTKIDRGEQVEREAGFGKGARERKHGRPHHGRHDLYTIDKIACEGCGVCAYFCPQDAISFDDEENGEWYVSNTRFGPMTHARLLPGAENSGKLVTLVRNEAKRIADEGGIELVLIDGSPGIGCPVIASVSGADLAVVVTEPTMSGIHDLERVVELTRHFDIETAVVVNKFDINEDMTRDIEEFAKRAGIRMLGGIRYDEAVTRAQIEGATAVEFSDGPASNDIRRIWNAVEELIGKKGS
jgi:MinD superfamily P-loop ATPase